jgi:hypothetical protein
MKLLCWLAAGQEENKNLGSTRVRSYRPVELASSTCFLSGMGIALLLVLSLTHCLFLSHTQRCQHPSAGGTIQTAALSPRVGSTRHTEWHRAILVDPQLNADGLQ